MKKIILSSMVMMICFIGLSQSTFEIKTIGSKYTLEQLTTAFSTADFCGSHFKTKRNSIKLDDGSVVELKSLSEISVMGIIVAESCFLNDDAIYYKAVWSIGENNIIMKGYDSEHSSDKEYKHYNLEEQ